MLADKLTSIGRGSRLAQAMGNGLASLQARVAAAPKLVADRSIAIAADGISYEEVVRTVDFLRLPFTSVWIEATHADRLSFVNSKVPPLPGDEPPSRVGVFCETLGRQSFGATLVWSTVRRSEINDQSVFICPLAAILDFSDGQSTLSALKLRGSVRMDGSLTHPMARHTGIRSCPYLDEMLLKYEANGGDVQAMLDGSAKDWSGELTFWLALLALLNTKNAVTKTDVSMASTNKTRRRLGRPTFHDHSVLKLRLPAAATPSEPAGDPAHDAAVRAHFVRGHFKVRKTGMFWWSPYVRGDLALGFRSKDYKLAAR